MTHLGLFEGIGGFSLAARWMGWETLAWCEWNEFGQKVLRYHFPKAEGFGDITKTDFTKYANRIDILTGGFPCQPYSMAGKRLGKADERHLWPEMLRAIREVRPRWIVGENVRGIISWNGGMVFNEVQADLEIEGYETIPFLLSACSKNAPHERGRVWFIAHANKEFGRFPIQSESNGTTTKRERPTKIGGENWKQFELASDSIATLTEWANRPASPEFYDGISTGLDVEAFFRGSNNAYGNAIVPQVALEIFKAIEKYEQLNPKP